jgi:hypothetical protein
MYVLWARELTKYQEVVYFSSKFMLYRKPKFYFVFKTGRLKTAQALIIPFLFPIL